MVVLKIFVIFAVLHVISCGNILFLNGIASPSHHLWSKVLIKGLVAQGHNITMVSVDNDKNPPPNVHYIFLEAVYETLYGAGSTINIMEMSDQRSFDSIRGNYEWYEGNCNGIIKSKGLDIILNYPNDFKFDAAIYDFSPGPCLLPLIHKFNYPPLISVSGFNNPPFTHHLMGGQKYPAYVPHYVTEYSNQMSFPQRTLNILLYFYDAM